MKKVLCAVVTVLLLDPRNAIAQTVPVVNKSVDGPSYSYNYSRNFITSNVPLNELSIKAYRNFEKNYAAIDKETWIKIPAGTMVTFVDNGVFYKLFYNTKGTFVYSYKFYDEKNCSAELIKMIQHSYPQYKIVNIVELFQNNKLLYGINISNGDSTKSLEMDNGETKLLSEFSNQ